MAFGRRKRSSAAKPRTSKKVHTVDGLNYDSAAMVKVHNAWKADELVKTFRLPTIEDKVKNKKFGAKKCYVNDYLFDSIMEAKFYIHLLHEQKAKRVKEFSMQETFELQEKFRDQFTKKVVRPITYIADFVILDADDNMTVVDVKGRETADFKLKKKMFQHKFRDVKFECVRWVAKEEKWLTLDEIKKIKKKAL